VNGLVGEISPVARDHSLKIFLRPTPPLWPERSAYGFADRHFGVALEERIPWACLQCVGHSYGLLGRWLHKIYLSNNRIF